MKHYIAVVCTLSLAMLLVIAYNSYFTHAIGVVVK